jgi:hypothetical protein
VGQIDGDKGEKPNDVQTWPAESCFFCAKHTVRVLLITRRVVIALADTKGELNIPVTAFSQSAKYMSLETLVGVVNNSSCEPTAGQTTANVHCLPDSVG